MLRNCLAEAEASDAPAANWLAEFATAARRGKDTVDDDVQYYLVNEAVSRARKNAEPVLDRHAMRLFLQIPSDNRFSTIDQVDFRRTLEALKGKVK